MVYSSAFRTCWKPKERRITRSLKYMFNLIYTFLFTPKKKGIIQFHFTFWMELNLSSKHLPFLSLHTVHHMHVGIAFHHFFWLLLPPLLIQLHRRSTVCSSIDQFVSVRIRNSDQICEVILQCENKWLLVSSASLHKKNLETIWDPLL